MKLEKGFCLQEILKNRSVAGMFLPDTMVISLLHALLLHTDHTGCCSNGNFQIQTWYLGSVHTQTQKPQQIQ